MQLAKLILFGLLGATACMSASPSEPTETDSTETETTSQLGEQPAAGCGYTCSLTGIVGMPYRACVNQCGAENCTPTPSPCP
jgi:hypothetical protein